MMRGDEQSHAHCSGTDLLSYHSVDKRKSTRPFCQVGYFFENAVLKNQDHIYLNIFDVVISKCQIQQLFTSQKKLNKRT